jgi:hypothetical protein
MLMFTSDSAVTMNLFKTAVLGRSFRRDTRALFLKLELSVNNSVILVSSGSPGEGT